MEICRTSQCLAQAVLVLLTPEEAKGSLTISNYPRSFLSRNYRILDHEQDQ